MALESLVQYIKRGIAGGDDEHHLRAILLDVGWKEDEIAEAFQYVRDDQMEPLSVDEFIDEVSTNMPGPLPVHVVFIETVIVVAVIVAMSMMIGNTYEFIFDESITMTASMQMLQATFGDILP